MARKKPIEAIMHIRITLVCFRVISRIVNAPAKNPARQLRDPLSQRARKLAAAPKR
jgi:hypothetical protein